ncbi:MAG: sensor domain-containing diguanylate cyclase [bacterium]|nr:sensor domain-containing diguanylate cyclase [bacterium]
MEGIKKENKNGKVNEQNNKSVALNEDFLEKNLHDFLIINRINKIMCSFLDHQDVIDSIIALTNEVIDTQAVAIIVKDDQKVKITLSISDLLDKKLIENFKTLSLNSFSEKERVKIELNDVEVILRENPLKVGKYVEDNFNSFHCVPITITENTYGFLSIGGLNKDAFSTESLRCLSILGSYSSVAIGNSILRDKIEELAIIDSLTGIYTHGYFREALRREIRRAERYDSSFSVIMLDIDDLSKINNSYGYLEGDRILKMLALEIKDKIIREIDIVARYGGEEFVIVLPETNKVRAMVVAERIRSQVELKDFYISGVNFKITASMGISNFPLDAKSEAELINAANFALLKAKEQGKNRIVRA